MFISVFIYMLKKKDNGEVYKLRKTFAVFHLVPLCFFLEEELIG